MRIMPLSFTILVCIMLCNPAKKGKVVGYFFPPYFFKLDTYYSVLREHFTATLVYNVQNPPPFELLHFLYSKSEQQKKIFYKEMHTVPAYKSFMWI